MLLTLVVPTRNEADNVPVLVRELRESLSDLDYRVVFVDDSTDETPEVIRDLGEEDKRITLIHRKGPERDGGLSTAVTTGIEAFAGMSEYTCVMDADLQHPPQKVREMLELATAAPTPTSWWRAATRRAAATQGSRGRCAAGRLRGQQVPGPGPLQGGAQDKRPDGGVLPGANDAISGIQFRPTGFKILLEILVCAPELKVVEAPLEFRARHAGVSKATFDRAWST